MLESVGKEKADDSPMIDHRPTVLRLVPVALKERHVAEQLCWLTRFDHINAPLRQAGRHGGACGALPRSIEPTEND
jgi:hypothetical protein